MVRNRVHCIAILNQKGGVGKTTLSVNLAAGLSERTPTRLIDLDPQGTAQAWTGLSQKPLQMQVEHVPEGFKPEVHLTQRGTHSAILLDCPPTLDGDTIAAVLRGVDRVLIPVLPSPLDLWSSLRLADWVEKAQKVNPGLTARLLINQLEPRSALSAAMESALREFSIPTLHTAVRRRAIYRSTAMEGQTVYEAGQSGAAARAEINAIIDEVLG